MGQIIKRLKRRSFLILTFVVVILSSFLLSYKLSLHKSDLFDHINYANQYLSGEYVFGSNYPAFYLLYGFFKLLGIADSLSGALAQTIFMFLCSIVIYCIASDILVRCSTYNNYFVKSMIVLYMHFFGPLYFFKLPYYVDIGSFNTWHNPGNTSVKFLAVFCFYLFSKLYFYDYEYDSGFLNCLNCKMKWKYCSFLFAFFCFFSIFFKPSFCQIFIPAIACIVFVDFLFGKTPFKTAVLYALMLLPAVFLLLRESLIIFFNVTGESVGGIAISPFTVWNHSSDNILVSLLKILPFPLFIYIYCKDNVPFPIKKSFSFSWILYIIAILEFILFVETGSRMYHGNFGWGKCIATGILHLWAIFQFIFWLSTNTNTVCFTAKKIIGLILPVLHLLCGVGYWFILLISDGVQCF